VTLPTRVPLEGLPVAITVYEVGARDGLQNEQRAIPTEVKLELIDRLAAAGLRTIEATSFVHPRWVPQLADAEDLMDRLVRVEGVRYPVLVPNAKGLQRALDRGARDVAIFVSATETFSQKNLNATIDQSLTMAEPVVDGALAVGAGVRAYLSMVFGDPWEGQVAIKQVVEVALRLMAMGCTELSLGDTIGVGTPGHVRALLSELQEAGIPIEQVAVHFHDTYGQALANVLASLQCGVLVVDSSAGGLGGCPYAESATGNLATEDLVWQLNGLGIETGVDLQALVATSSWMAGVLGRPSASRTVQALARKESS
jgi:hydroxymethylglutaryl-CoA lyase